MNVLLACNDIVKHKLEKIIKDQIKDFQLITVCELLEYNSLNFKKLQLKQVFIHVQLDWFSKNSINQGYELALNLMNNSSNQDSFIQVRFFSIDKQQDLINEVLGDKFLMARAFQHIHFLDDSTFIFEDYSKEHYKFIKLLALKKSGILLFIKHELSTVLKNNISELSDQKKQVKDHLNAIMLYEHELQLTKTIEKLEQLDESSFSAAINALLQDIELLVLKESGVKKSQKLNYSVLIVEDDQEMLEVLVDICEENFEKVYPSKKELSNYNVKEAFKKLNKKGNDFNVMILDILFKKPDTSFELISGIDFLNIANRDYPYLTTRVVTNVSRQIISSLLNITIKDLYPKNMGKATLKEFIINDIAQIKEDCLAKEKSKRLRNIGPKIGYFQFPGVWDQIESLIESDSFETFWSESGLKNLNEFEKHHDRILNFDGKLPTPRNKTVKSNSSDEIEKYLKNLFTFRLLFFDFFIRDSSHNKLQAEAIEDFEKNTLQVVSDRKNCDSSFLNMIAISASKNNIDLSFEIKLSNLFPQEIEWLLPKLGKKSKVLVTENNPELAKWFYNIRVLLKEKMEIDYSHINVIDYAQLDEVLDKVLTSQKMILEISDYLSETFDTFNVSDINLPKSTKAKLHAIFKRFE